MIVNEDYVSNSFISSALTSASKRLNILNFEFWTNNVHKCAIKLMILSSSPLSWDELTRMSNDSNGVHFGHKIHLQPLTLPLDYLLFLSGR